MNFGVMPTNWDGTLTGDMINFTENRDSIGFDPTTRRWYAPDARKGYDPNQRGMGVDINTNQYVKPYLKKDARGTYLTEQDEKHIRHKSLDDAYDSYQQRLLHAKRTTGMFKDPSEMKMALTINAIYNLGQGTVASELFEDKELMRSLMTGTDDEYAEHIIRYFVKHRKRERPALVRQFMEYYKNKMSHRKPKLLPRRTNGGIGNYDWNAIPQFKPSWQYNR